MTDERDMVLTGWGRTAPTRATLVRPADVADVTAELASAGPRGVLARGLGRSYGDVAQNSGGVVLDMTGLHGIEAFDERTGALTALAGTSFDAILRTVVPRGWFLPVTPGTRFVTLGGAIANDVHGKNHHRDGGLGDHVSSFDLLVPGGEIRTIQPRTDPEVFEATLGGLGLTGVLVRATVRLMPIGTSRMLVDTERADDLDDLMARMVSSDRRRRYSVAWVDALARGSSVGRGVLTSGDHARASDLDATSGADPCSFRPRKLPSVPPHVPNLITRATAGAFDELWFRKAPRASRGRVVSMTSFFHPLDAVGAWNRLYGRRGFVQYQFVVPFGEEAVVRRVLERIAVERAACCLTVLKRFGPGRGMLSFPVEGWTLALDLPAGAPRLGKLLDGFDRAVADAGGRVYLAKDARLDPGLLHVMYPELDRWREVRERLDPSHVLRSDLERRLPLDLRERTAVRA